MQYRCNDDAVETIYIQHVTLIQPGVTLHTHAKSANVESALWIMRMCEIHADTRIQCEVYD